MATKRKKAAPRARRMRVAPKVHAAIVTAVEAGSYAATAARAAGVREHTFESWMRDARADEAAGVESDVRALADAIDKADAQAENTQVADVEKAEWLLERMRPEKFGQRITIDAKKGAAMHLLDILRDGISDEAFDEVIKALSREGL